MVRLPRSPFLDQGHIRTICTRVQFAADKCPRGAIHGLVDVEAVARIDSKRGGIRVSFEETPDAPISKAVFEFPGGKKGLIVNSRELCRTPPSPSPS